MFQNTTGCGSRSSIHCISYAQKQPIIYINFKNVISTNRVKIPFGIAQIGKAFRNEITPKQFLFRMREFEQMEMEWFCKAEEVLQKFFDYWINNARSFYQNNWYHPRKNYACANILKMNFLIIQHAAMTLNMNFLLAGKSLKELLIAADFDLTQHSKYSGKDLAYYDEETKHPICRMLLNLLLVLIDYF